MRRNIRDRVSTLAPFLTFDSDPYIVLGEDGRLSWIMDAFTVSDSYPYSTHYQLGNDSINYMRNSVKAVIDAYDGTTTFYVFDSEDPIIAAYRRIFPSLFKDASTMPPGLRKHVRYPELLLKLQAEVYGLYHMTDPEAFYNREDLWTVATEVGMSDTGEQTTQVMQPNFVLMKLPGEGGRGVRRNSALYSGKPEQPDRLDCGAQRRRALWHLSGLQLSQNKTGRWPAANRGADRSERATLRTVDTVESAGSHVRRGTLLVIPTGRHCCMPSRFTCKRSGVRCRSCAWSCWHFRIAWPTGQHLKRLWRRSLAEGLVAQRPRDKRRCSPGGSCARHTGICFFAPSRQPISKLSIAEAAKDLADYQRLTAEGKLGEAGKKLEELKRALDKLNTRQH